MRLNMPVTGIETKVRPDQYLVSKTDTKGIVTYANPAFVAISGFSRDELIGQPHNLVRHPDMPPEAFQDLWDTLKAGKPWLGLVKNRRKDGGFYWVLANVTPIIDDDQVVGYASVRVQPDEAQVAATEALYAAMRDTPDHGIRLQGGVPAPTGLRRLLRMLGRPFGSSLRASMFRMAALSTAGLAVAASYAYTGGFSPAVAPWAGAGLALVAAGTFVYGWVISQRMQRSLAGATGIARQVAAGNLLIDIERDEPGEVGELYFYLDLMRKSLLGIASDVQEGIVHVQQAGQQLQDSNHHLAQRTQAEGASLHDTAASMEELTVTVRQNADHARLASELADNSMDIASRGGAVVGEVVGTMQEIHQRSRRIGDIVTLIEEIAFQTNILALNAAVESARAGEAGRGFAVVAGEVRSLAQKSAQAAKEIKALIDDSTQSMEVGSEQAAHAGRTMDEIVEAVQRVNTLISEISTASREQSIGLEQINRAVNQMESDTRSNTELVGSLGDSVNALNYQAHHLENAVGALRIDRRADAEVKEVVKAYRQRRAQQKRAAAQAAAAIDHAADAPTDDAGQHQRLTLPGRTA